MADWSVLFSQIFIVPRGGGWGIWAIEGKNTQTQHNKRTWDTLHNKCSLKGNFNQHNPLGFDNDHLDSCQGSGRMLVGGGALKEVLALGDNYRCSRTTLRDVIAGHAG